jgi:hypothetical protein
MRITIDLPEDLVKEAMEITKCETMAELIELALGNIIVKEKVKGLKDYCGKANLDIDLDQVRER